MRARWQRSGLQHRGAGRNRAEPSADCHAAPVADRLRRRDRRRVPHRTSAATRWPRWSSTAPRSRCRTTRARAPPSAGRCLSRAGTSRPTRSSTTPRTIRASEARTLVGRSAHRDRQARHATSRTRCPAATRKAVARVHRASCPDGQYPVTLSVTDAREKPREASTASVAVDGTPPSVDLRRPRGRTLILKVADAASGLAAGQISVRNTPAEPFRPLPTTYRKGALRAPLDRATRARVDIAVTTRDNAGNEVIGPAARIRVTSVTSQRLRATGPQGRAGPRQARPAAHDPRPGRARNGRGRDRRAGERDVDATGGRRGAIRRGRRNGHDRERPLRHPATEGPGADFPHQLPRRARCDCPPCAR